MVRERDSPMSSPLMRQNAEDLAAKMGHKEVVATDGRFHRWRKRLNVVFKQTHGGQKSADVATVDQQIEKECPQLIASCAPKDVSDADESGLYYRAMPSHTYLSKAESTKGYQVSKEPMCCIRMTGEKRMLLEIRKSKRSRSLKGIKKLSVNYFDNISAWKTSVIFNNWLQK
ncbi:Tigger transposable element-derived protein 4 [Araneus ventricosus]|uniref:Tigger transposable element-derived protein 4 n=1 Tax=Araneus ventricosus TaxID=182803 RepID=A0A4Y2MY72_ARAVE|nr:Tigger transposable element-derived protein 4 [Araneus ventricosus]